MQLIYILFMVQTLFYRDKLSAKIEDTSAKIWLTNATFLPISEQFKFEHTHVSANVNNHNWSLHDLVIAATVCVHFK